MTEVKRYYIGKYGLVEGQALGRLSVVLSSNFDTLQSCLDDTERQRFDEQKACVAAERLVAELQQRLTAADEALDTAADEYALLSLEAGQRMELLEGLLLRTNELLYEIQGDPGAVPSSAIDWLRGEVFTAFKPAEGGGDE